MEFMGANQGSIPAFILSLIGGLIVLLYSLFSLVTFGIYGPYWNGIGGWMDGMMGFFTISWVSTAALTSSSLSLR
jgi:hypothetical protein